MKRTALYILLAGLVFGSSCKKDFLEVIDKTKLLKEGYVVDLNTTEQYMNGVYRDMAIEFAQINNLCLPEIAADNVKPRATATTGIEPNVYRWNITREFDVASGPWYKEYRIIRSCNFVLEKIDEYKDQNLSKADYLKGQALSLRAWMHFILVNSFAQPYNFTLDASHLGVPYVRTSDIEERVRRQTVAEVYQAMIADLNEAVRLLPSTLSNKTFLNYQAAKSLLARIYLFKEDYSNAKTVSVQILNDVPLMTAGYPSNLYKPTETEALFQLPPGWVDANDYNSIFPGYNYNNTSFIEEFATNDITQLYRTYPTDKRNAWVKDSSIGKVINKFPRRVTGTHVDDAADYYQTLLRSSEMALTAAEAFAKLSTEDSARYYINQIRTRAGIPALTSTITGTPLMDSIKLERRKEMAFDGIRMFDLLRWKQGVSRQDAVSPEYQSLSYPNNKAIFPIPKPDVQLSGLQQNPGY